VSRKQVVFWTILGVLLIDQVLKIYIKTNIEYGHGFDILGLSWAKIHFIENKGMAFGMSFGGEIGKYILSVFRILMVGLLGYLLNGLIKEKQSKWLIFSFTLIVAGAVGNIIDSIFYGLIFSPSSYHGGLAEFVEFGKGYAPVLQGKVVDMLYFPMVDTILPSWVPFWGGERFEFFQPVFNIADASISVGVTSILLFHRAFFLNEDKKKDQKQENKAVIQNNSEEE
jgi:signal peptidase II